MEWNWLVQPNDTLCNISDPLSCHGHGACEYDSRKDAVVCSCDNSYDPQSNCRLTIFEVYDGKTLAFPIVGIIILIPMVILYSLEIAVDVHRRGIKKAFKTAAWLAKLALLSLSITRIIWYSTWAYHSNTRTFTLVVLEGVTGSLGTVFAMAVCIVAIAWLDLIEQVRSLGEKSGIHKVRKFLAIFMAVVFPITLVLSLVIKVGFLDGTLSLFLYLILNGLFGLVFLVFAVVSTYELITLRHWLREQAALAKIHRENQKKENGDHGPKHLKMNSSENLVYRTRFLIVLTVLMWLAILAAILQIIFGSELALRYFAMQVVSRYLETILPPLMFFFVENYAFRFGFLSYLAAWEAEHDSMKTETKPTANKVDVLVTFSNTNQDTISKNSERATENKTSEKQKELEGSKSSADESSSASKSKSDSESTAPKDTSSSKELSSKD